MIRAAVLLALLALPGCFIRDTSVGIPLPPHYDQLEVGVTTRGEALRIVGAPHTVRRQSDGDLYLYGRVHDYSERLQLIPFITFYERTEGQIYSDRLVLFFDGAGILQGVGVEKEIPTEQ
jgi:hypothetical protein